MMTWDETVTSEPVVDPAQDAEKEPPTSEPM
jgi:hypothetical protein